MQMARIEVVSKIYGRANLRDIAIRRNVYATHCDSSLPIMLRVFFIEVFLLLARYIRMCQGRAERRIDTVERKFLEVDPINETFAVLKHSKLQND